MEEANSVKGLCYSEDILDLNDIPISRMIFNFDCIPIDNANGYINNLLICKRCSYNSIKVTSYDLCKFYNFLNLKNKCINEITTIDLRGFIIFLKNLQIRKGTVSGIDYKHKRYAIENTIVTEIPTLSNIKLQNVTSIDNYRSLIGLSDESICRIVYRVKDYLIFLSENRNYKFDVKLLKTLSDKNIFKRFLTSENISKSAFGIKPINDDMVFSKEEIETINNCASTHYEPLLYFILEHTGIRIGEALGLKIKLTDRSDIKEGISGDINFEDSRWKISINWRPENPPFCRTKGHCSREVFLKKSQSYEFQLLLERYLKHWYSSNKLNKISWLFENNMHKQLTQNTAYIQFKRTVKKAGISFSKPTLHKYRHTFCTAELRKGTPIEFVSKLLGHKSIETTRKIYEHMTSLDIAIAREKYDKYTGDSFYER